MFNQKLWVSHQANCVLSRPLDGPYALRHADKEHHCSKRMEYFETNMRDYLLVNCNTKTRKMQLFFLVRVIYLFFPPCQT